MVDLTELGWGPFFEAEWNSEDVSHWRARVVEEHKHAYRVLGERGLMLAEVAGHLRHAATGRPDFPAVGDWVAVDEALSEGRAIIHRILRRKTRFSRKTAGETVTEQIVAANIDTVFLVTSLNSDLNLRRIERYIAMIWESGAQPVILLSKADLCGDLDRAMRDVAGVAAGVPVHPISALTTHGLENIQKYLQPGVTVALLGSSGVGKSTIINTVLGVAAQEVLEIRKHDDRGRHATTYRKLFVLPKGGILIDTPGMRELQLWDAESGVQQTFDDIETLAQSCRFGDCGHQSEPGCAVRQSLRSGLLHMDRFQSYLKLKKELKHTVLKHDVLQQSEEKKRWKKIHKAQKKHYKLKSES